MSAWISPTYRAQLDAINGAVMEQVERYLRALNTAIEACCIVAIERGCGVRVDTYQGGGWSARVDDTNPNMEICEYQHGHTQYPLTAHPGCVNCESRDG